MNSKQLEIWLASDLGNADFQKKGRNWYRRTGETVVMVNLDKSPDGGQHYVNLAASPLALTESIAPQEHRCHIRVRLESVSPDREQLLQALDLEDPWPTAEDRRRAISHALAANGLPLLQQWGSLDGIRQTLDDHPNSRRFFVLKTLRDYLESMGKTS